MRTILIILGLFFIQANICAFTVRADEKPNILIFLVDDQSRGQVRAAMPFTWRTIFKKGLIFKQQYISRPLCCPSRAGILTGLYPENNGVTGNGAPLLVEPTLLKTAQQMGFKVSVYGKYLNSHDGTPIKWVDDWAVFPIPNQYRLKFDLNHNGELLHLKGYQLPILKDYFIRGFDPSRANFVYFAPTLPHLPAITRPRYYKRFAGRQLKTPRYNIKDRLSFFGGRYDEKLDSYSRQLAASYHLDLTLKRIFKTLRAAGRPFFIYYLSDNGLLLGEHAVFNQKNVPLETAVHVPAALYNSVLNLNGLKAGLILNIDLMPTIFGLLNVQFSNIDGLDIFRQPRAFGCLSGTSPGKWAGIITADKQKAIVYETKSGRKGEFYIDLKTDRFELRPKFKIPESLMPLVVSCQK